MKEFRAKTIINAPANHVFATLTNLEIYRNFDPHYISIEGKVAQNGMLKIRSKITPFQMVNVRITEFKSPETMVWESGLFFNLFKMVRTFNVLAKDDQTTEFELIEVFSGPLLGFFNKTISKTTATFKEFTKDLKRSIESRK